MDGQRVAIDTTAAKRSVPLPNVAQSRGEGKMVQTYFRWEICVFGRAAAIASTPVKSSPLLVRLLFAKL